MPVIKSAKKKLRADVRKRAGNLKVKNNVKSGLKDFKSKPTPSSLAQAYSVLDVAVKKGVLPKRRADRKKSRLVAMISKSTKEKSKRGKLISRTSEKSSKN
jgi:ribosomal protein S20